LLLILHRKPIPVLLKKNDIAVKDMIKKEPLKGVTFFYEECKRKQILISKSKLKHFLLEIREEIFPSKKELALSNVYCRTIDGQPFLLSRSSIQVIKKNKGKAGSSLEECVIFSSPFLVSILSESSQ